MNSNSGKRRKNQSQYDDDLFSAPSDSEKPRGTKVPLADRMRPRSFGEFVGQSSIVGEGRLLRRAIEADQVTSLIWTQSDVQCSLLIWGEQTAFRGYFGVKFG